MKKFNYRKAAVRLTAALFFTGLFNILPGMSMKSHAAMITDEMMQEALSEEFGDGEEMEDIDDYYDQDINQFIEEYMKKIEADEVQFEDLEMDHVKDPSMRMAITEDGNIRYTLPDGEYFDVTVPNGIITGNAVEFYPHSDIAAVVTKDGESTSLFNSWRFSSPGNYHIKMLFYGFDDDTYENNEIYEVNFYFTIIDRVSGSVGAVPTPDGFEIISAKKDGVPLSIENPACLFLDGDGRFEIRYRDIETRSVYAATSFERDTTAPFLTFSKDLGNGKVQGPVTFTTSDVSDRVYLSYNGYTAETVNYELTDAGSYGLEVVDTAGNSRFYYLEISRKSGLLNTKLIILALILLLGAGARFLLSARDMEAI